MILVKTRTLVSCILCFCFFKCVIGFTQTETPHSLRKKLQFLHDIRKKKVVIEIHDVMNDSGHNKDNCVNIKIPVNYTS